jgi:hypothetical protein
MSSFSAEWLALREPFDIAARDDELAISFLEESNLRAQRAQVAQRMQGLQGLQGLQGAQAGPIVDLGAGTGSNISRLRSLAEKLGHQLSWRHVDNDGDLLALARHRFSGDSCVSIEQRDICLDLEDALQGTSAVTCAALLDLVSAAWINQLADRLARERLPLLALLSYDGRMQWSLADATDAILTQSFHRDMLSDKGFGPALGPAAAFALDAALVERGATTQLRDSYWRITASESAMLTAMNASLSAAALRAAQGPERNAIEAWTARRALQIAAGEVSLVVGHQELLATWP